MFRVQPTPLRIERKDESVIQVNAHREQFGSEEPDDASIGFAPTNMACQPTLALKRIVVRE